MLRGLGAFVILAGVSATTAWAELPPILTGSDNAVPQCVTPGRLMAYLKMRNPELNPRYDGIATQYMRFGEELGMRWDIAFYQMILETGALSYKRGNRSGDVRPEQNNFAGLGATGNGVRGESFRDVETGVRAHLEHLMLYAGKPVENPVADRTRKVQEWHILDAWQQSFKRPLTYTDLATKWAPGSWHYASMVQQIGDFFHSTLCRQPDPRPELVREARALILGSTGKVADAAAGEGQGSSQGSGQGPGKSLGRGAATVRTAAAEKAAGESDVAASDRPSGEALAKRAIAQAAEDGTDKRSGLGVTTPPEESATPSASAPYKVAGAPPSAESKATAIVSKAGAEKAAGKSAEKASTSRMAVAGAGMSGGGAGTASGKSKMLPETALPPSANQRCRVWTASYGGQKALIIRSVSDQVVNFTVLDVNDGAEQREAEAFIAAYAKNGKIAGEYPSQAHALDKAFELCPEG